MKRQNHSAQQRRQGLLEKENTRVKKWMADSTLKNGLLKEALLGKYGTGRGRQSKRGSIGTCNSPNDRIGELR